MNIIFWDIDGTLVRTDKAGLYAFIQATQDIFGSRPDFGQITTAGMTDCHIGSEIISAITGTKPQEKEIAALLRHYEELLPAHLAARRGYSIQPVMEILTALQAEPEFVSLLLTGNTVAGATAKLARYNLIQFFDFSVSAFGDSCHDRSGVAAQALAHLQRKFPADTGNTIFVIGDTPNDIRCGKEIGAKTIAVATGPFSVEELAAHSPWWAVEQLPAPAEFIAKLSAN